MVTRAFMCLCHLIFTYIINDKDYIYFFNFHVLKTFFFFKLIPTAGSQDMLPFLFKEQKHTINWTVPKDTQKSGQEVMRLMGNAVYLLRTTCTTQISGTNTVPSLLSSSLRFSSHIVYEWLVCFSILNAENPGGPFTPTSASTRHILHCHRLIMPSETDIDINRYSQCSLWYKPHG